MHAWLATCEDVGGRSFTTCHQRFHCREGSNTDFVYLINVPRNCECVAVICSDNEMEQHDSILFQENEELFGEFLHAECKFQAWEFSSLHCSGAAIALETKEFVFLLLVVIMPFSFVAAGIM